MNEQEEAAWVEGERFAWRQLLRMAIQQLGMQGRSPESWVLEREAAIAALREICRDHGDNDWDPSLHLADIINKHLDLG